MPILPFLPAIISGATAIGGAIFNKKSTDKTNQQQQNFALQQYQQQKDDNIKFWEMQNAYNDPSAQMQRMKDANLNPHLIYGNGTDVKAGPIANASAPQWNPKAPQINTAPFQQSLMDIYDIAQKKANIAQTQAATEKIQSETANRQFLNQLNNPEWLESMNLYNRNHGRLTVDSMALENESKEQRNRHGVLDLKTKDALTGDTPAENKIVSKYLTDLTNAKLLGDAQGFNNQMLKLETELNKMGIQKNDQLWQRIIGRLLNLVIK